jgi:hypothetical protein
MDMSASSLRRFKTYIDNHSSRILENLGDEPIEVYLFLSNRFCKCDVSKDKVFQFVFRSFYRLDLAGLTIGFKDEYFKTLEGLRTARLIDLTGLVRKFRELPTLRGHKSLQFSFVTKLAHTVDATYPVFDDDVATTFAFSRPTGGDFESRLACFLAFYERLRSTYSAITTDGLIWIPFARFARNSHSARRLCRKQKSSILPFGRPEN